jgi:chemotaxis protein MotA
MDIATIIGLVGSFGMMVMSIYTSGGAIGAIMDLPSFLMVVVGSYFALMTSVPLSEALGLFKIMGKTFNVPNFGEATIVTKLMSFSDKARREGLLALEDELDDLDDEFMKKGLRLVVDGTDAAIIRDLLEIEIDQMQARHSSKFGVLTQWSALAPGFGMLGTVVGLINMLKNQEDKASIGPNMALALVTTLYGSIVANVVLLPVLSKLRGQDGGEAHAKEMVLEGILSIQAGDNPRTLQLKMMAYLTPAERKAFDAESSRE